MSELQVQARALGDPTRFSLFRHVVDAGAPVDIASLTAHVGLNHNSVRQHLAKLVEAGLVVETSAPPRGKGRPRLLYAAHPAADSRWGVVGPYEHLAMLLTEVVRTGEDPEEVGRRAGQRQRLGATAASAAPVAAFADVMAHLGFDPAVAQEDESVTVTLRRCPYASAVLTDADTVCTLHLGLARGVADAVGGLVVDDLVPRDPRRAQCELHLTSAPAGVPAT